MERGEVNRYSFLPPAIGAVVVLLLLFEILLGFREPIGFPPVSSSVLGVPFLNVYLLTTITSVACTLTVFLASYWYIRHLPSARHEQVSEWTVGGVLFFTLLVGSIGLFLFDGALGKVASVRWSISIGSAIGVVTGIFNARAIQQAIENERLQTQAVEQRRELLAYLNSLLRHEVLNSVQVITGHADLIKQAYADEQDGHHHIETIERNAEELESIIVDVRELINSTHGDTELERVDICDLLQSELDKLEGRFKQRVDWETDMPAEAYVRVDPLAPQLFSNLLNNAVEHNTSEVARIRVDVETTAEEVIARIEDNGPGIPAEEEDELFDDTVGKSLDHGLGLLIVRQLAHRYGGDVELTETGPQGSVFTVTLPRAKHGPESAETPLTSLTDGGYQ